ncbi:HaeIII family restriction endonuclease [Lutispora sp.]|uniref:HaeIII family restriction endonuclease n=1 Tax=Lutispora sp. TaxID=2828727 RepID=UPI0035689D7F
MPRQVQLGKAFEYACLTAIYNRLSTNQTITIEQNDAYNSTREFYNTLQPIMQQKMISAANAALNVLLRLEPLLENPNGDIPLYLSIQEDARGIAGDVRDILMIRRGTGWEIGLSVKHNHMAVKHSRLSDVLDFGASWLNIPCSTTYFEEIRPLFSQLRELKGQGIKWNQVPNKGESYYLPILQSFISELRRLDAANPGVVPARLMSYLLGNYDFYKVISIDNRRMTKIQAFSLYGTLNRPAAGVRPMINLPNLHLPTRIFDIYFKQNSNNTVIIALDQGWQISLRIHSASTYVEPSLKFDIQLIGIPQNLYSHEEAWV